MRLPTHLRRLLLASFLTIAGLGFLAPGSAFAADVSGNVYDSNLNDGVPVGQMSYTITDLSNSSQAPITGTFTGDLWAATLPNSTDVFQATITGADYNSATTPYFTASESSTVDTTAYVTPLMGTIKGTVTDGATGLGVYGVKIGLTGDTYSHDTYTTLTDSAGTGTYSVSVPDDQNYDLSFNSPVVDIGPTNEPEYQTATTTGVPVSPSGTTTRNETLTPATAEISGTVTNSANVALSGVLVDAFDASGTVVATSTTYANGHYTLYGLSTGSYTVGFIPADDPSVYLYQFRNGTLAGTQEPANATPVSTTTGSSTNGVVASLQTGASISGTVTDANGNPLPDAEVFVRTISDQGLSIPDYGTAFPQALTATDGTYTISGLPAGSYIVLASDGGYADTYFGNVPTAAQATTVPVSSGGTAANTNVTLPAGATISGTVTEQGSNAPLANVYVELWQGGTELDGGQITATNGTYSFTDLPAGTYQLYFSATAGDVSAWLGGASTQATSTSVTVTAGSTQTENQALVPGSFVIGTVTDGATGQPLDGDYVYAYDTAGAVVASARSDVDGDYRLGPLAPGTYRVRFSSLASLAWQYYQGATTLSGATTLTVSTGANTTGISATLNPGGSISGTVTDAGTGAPLDDVEVDLLDPAGNPEVSTNTGPDGTYRFSGIPTGSVAVEFEGGAVPGTATIYQTQYLGGSATLAGSKLASVSSGQTTSGVNAAMQAATTPGATATVTETITTPTSATPVTAPKPTKPTLTLGKLGGIAKGRAALSFKLTQGQNGAGALKLITVTLPKGLSFVTKQLKRDLTLTQGDRFTDTVVKGVLRITLKTAQRTVTVTLKSGAIKVSAALKREAATHKLTSAKVTVTTTDARNTRTTLTYTIKKPS